MCIVLKCVRILSPKLNLALRTINSLYSSTEKSLKRDEPEDSDYIRILVILFRILVNLTRKFLFVRFQSEFQSDIFFSVRLSIFYI